MCHIWSLLAGARCGLPLAPGLRTRVTIYYGNHGKLLPVLGLGPLVRHYHVCHDQLPFMTGLGPLGRSYDMSQGWLPCVSDLKLFGKLSGWHKWVWWCGISGKYRTRQTVLAMVMESTHFMCPPAVGQPHRRTQQKNKEIIVLASASAPRETFHKSMLLWQML